MDAWMRDLVEDLTCSDTAGATRSAQRFEGFVIGAAPQEIAQLTEGHLSALIGQAARGARNRPAAFRAITFLLTLPTNAGASLPAVLPAFQLAARAVQTAPAAAAAADMLASLGAGPLPPDRQAARAAVAMILTGSLTARQAPGHQCTAACFAMATAGACGAHAPAHDPDRAARALAAVEAGALPPALRVAAGGGPEAGPLGLTVMLLTECFYGEGAPDGRGRARFNRELERHARDAAPFARALLEGRVAAAGGAAGMLAPPRPPPRGGGAGAAAPESDPCMANAANFSRVLSSTPAGAAALATDARAVARLVAVLEASAAARGGAHPGAPALHALCDVVEAGWPRAAAAAGGGERILSALLAYAAAPWRPRDASRATHIVETVLPLEWHVGVTPYSITKCADAPAKLVKIASHPEVGVQELFQAAQALCLGIYAPGPGADAATAATDASRRGWIRAGVAAGAVPALARATARGARNRDAPVDARVEPAMRAAAAGAAVLMAVAGDAPPGQIEALWAPSGGLLDAPTAGMAPGAAEFAVGAGAGSQADALCLPGLDALVQRRRAPAAAAGLRALGAAPRALARVAGALARAAGSALALGKARQLAALLIAVEAAVMPPGDGGGDDGGDAGGEGGGWAGLPPAAAAVLRGDALPGASARAALARMAEGAPGEGARAAAARALGALQGGGDPRRVVGDGDWMLGPPGRGGGGGGGAAAGGGGRVCSGCGKTAGEAGVPKLRACKGGCGGRAAYCGAECQRADWRAHRGVCSKGA
ncbi:MAG: hypothetical protein J3K34DRAFT_524032 [Monoraphidium minutum]|nr:MAG: hypothetical protein J3K34DRAFT_524032 [Monoraphidium minutum]